MRRAQRSDGADRPRDASARAKAAGNVLLQCPAGAGRASPSVRRTHVSVLAMTNPKRPMEGLLRRFFRSKVRELLGASEGVFAAHRGLRGSHREQACREFLAEFLPRRYSVGKGMLFDNIGHSSRECDVVIWDDDNYPRLQEKGHTLFIVNSVRCVVEVKSRWSDKRWSEAILNARSVRDVHPNTYTFDGVGSRLQMLEHQVEALRMGGALEGMLLYPHYVGTAAIFLAGGVKLTAAALAKQTDEPDYDLPDLTLLLEPGLLIENKVVRDGDRLKGRVELRRLGEDALFGFMMRLLDLIRDRSAAIENSPHFSDAFDLNLDRPCEEGFDFQLTRPPARVQTFYSEGTDGNTGA